MPDELFDSEAALKPLLDAVPGSKFCTTCGRCGQRIIGLAALDERAFFVHPGECPPAPERKTPEGMLL